LSIVTKAEKANGRVWDPMVGLIPKQFDYSSSILNTGKSFKIKEGVIEAKVKFSAIGAITSAFSLTGSNPFPQIDVFRSGQNCVGIGIIDRADKNGTKKLVQIKGLNFNNFHIFRLEIFGNELVWKINNHEVHREQLTKSAGELFLNFVGSLHQPVNGGSLPHYFEIDWVRCLRKKQSK
jgi:beta-glucanase (GH16 family)